MFGKAKVVRNAPVGESLSKGPGAYNAVHSPECFKAHKKGALATSTAGRNMEAAPREDSDKENLGPLHQLALVDGQKNAPADAQATIKAAKQKLELEQLHVEKKGWLSERKALSAKGDAMAKALKAATASGQGAEAKAKLALTKERELKKQLLDLKARLSDSERHAKGAAKDVARAADSAARQKDAATKIRAMQERDGLPCFCLRALHSFIIWRVVWRFRMRD
jgi:hypothetical protein